ncbi:hypothetical protein BpHYR1_021987 [Brachionus plicatilis]|uniref:Uncharacterized protein n=1 Tax=Brachionus plicatilis TaxID=10195 RepID=A0A3M7QSK3_BRAPC|nr:hypothetical protein BpHYR1_021987 [Brachionus plicatilis]
MFGLMRHDCSQFWKIIDQLKKSLGNFNTPRPFLNMLNPKRVSDDNYNDYEEKDDFDNDFEEEMETSNQPNTEYDSDEDSDNK